MFGQALRNFAIDLLDDDHGINRTAWETLSDMLYDADENDIVDAVSAQDGRFYLPEDVVDSLRVRKDYPE